MLATVSNPLQGEAAGSTPVMIHQTRKEKRTMGYMRHHTIVVTGIHYEWDERLSIKAVHEKAKSIFKWVSPLSPGLMNGFISFFVPPDGSKEGWSESDEGNAEREKFIQYLESIAYEDGSSPVDWVEVQFGDDELETRVVRDNDARRRGAKYGEKNDG